MSISVLKIVSGKLDIKRHPPSILYLCFESSLETFETTGLTLCLLGNFACFLASADFLKSNFYEKKNQEFHQSVSLDPDQVGIYVGPVVSSK